MKPKFDGYAAQYDAWFMENENLFQSELRLFQKVLGDIQGKRVLSVGCGSGLFESMIDCSGIEGIEPSRDMGAIAEKRGVNVVAFGAIEDVELEENAYDVIYRLQECPQAERHLYFAGRSQGERLWVHVSAGKRGRHL